MKKHFRHFLYAALALSCLIFVAAKPNGITGLTSLWVGDQTATADVTPGDNDVYINGTLEVDGAVRFDGAVTTTGTTYSQNMDVGSALIYSGAPGGPIQVGDLTAPGIASPDLMGAIVYDDSSETASVGWNFFVPSNYSGSLSFRMLVSTNTNDSYASMGVDWSMLVNEDDTAFDAVASPQTIVYNTGNSSPSTVNTVLTFTPDAGTLSPISAGDIVTVWFWNSDARTSGTTANLEIKTVERRFQ